MYNLPYFKEKDEHIIREFIAKHPFAFICGSDENHHPVATQIPVFLEDENGKMFLRGHIMKNTDHHKAFLQNQNVLVVFTGPHTYVSATWYSNPHQASTWNYMSVHAKGTMRFLSEDDLIEILQKTSLYFENHNHSSTTVYKNLPVDYKEKLLKATVAFEIQVDEFDHVFKLSQNKDAESYQNIQTHLKNGGTDEQEMIAKEMEKRNTELFPDKLN